MQSVYGYSHTKIQLQSDFIILIQVGFKTLFADAEICVQPPYRFPQLHPKRMQGKVPWLCDMTWAVECLQKYVADILRKQIVE